MMLVSMNAATVATLTIPLVGRHAGVVVLDAAIGPVQLIDKVGAGYTVLDVPLQIDPSKIVKVKLRASRGLGGCVRAVMNAKNACSAGASNMYFALNYEPSDNPALPPGLYNGTLELKALDANIPESTWSPKILASITIQKK